MMLFLAGMVVGIVFTVVVVAVLALCGMAKDIDTEE